MINNAYLKYMYRILFLSLMIGGAKASYNNERAFYMWRDTTYSKIVQAQQYAALYTLLEQLPNKNSNKILLELERLLSGILKCKDVQQKKVLHQSILDMLLFWCAETNAVANAKELIEQGANVNATVNFEYYNSFVAMRPLFVAVQSDNEEMVLWLLGQGADANFNLMTSIQDKNGKTSLESVPCNLLSFSSNPSVTALLMSAMPATAVNCYFPLVPQGCKDFVFGSESLRLANEVGESHHGIPFFRGGFPIHHLTHGAIVTFSTDVRAAEKLAQNIELLISKGASINAKDSKGNTIFHLLARKPELHTSVLRLLCNSTNKNMVKFIKQSMKQKNKKGETPLLMIMKYTRKNHLDSVKILMELESNIEEPNLQGITAIDKAAERGLLPALIDAGLISREVILKKDSLNRTRLHQFLSNRKALKNSYRIYKTVKGYKNIGIDIHAQDNEGKTMSDSMDDSLRQYCSPLFELKININQRTNNKKTKQQKRRERKKNKRIVPVQKNGTVEKEEEEEINNKIEAFHKVPLANCNNAYRNITKLARPFNLNQHYLNGKILKYAFRIPTQIEADSANVFYHKSILASDIFTIKNGISDKGRNKTFGNMDKHFYLPVFSKLAGEPIELVALHVCQGNNNVIYHRGRIPLQEKNFTFKVISENPVELYNKIKEKAKKLEHVFNRFQGKGYILQDAEYYARLASPSSDGILKKTIISVFQYNNDDNNGDGIIKLKDYKNHCAIFFLGDKKK